MWIRESAESRVVLFRPNKFFRQSAEQFRYPEHPIFFPNH